MSYTINFDFTLHSGGVQQEPRRFIYTNSGVFPPNSSSGILITAQHGDLLANGGSTYVPPPSVQTTAIGTWFFVANNAGQQVPITPYMVPSPAGMFPYSASLGQWNCPQQPKTGLFDINVPNAYTVYALPTLVGATSAVGTPPIPHLLNPTVQTIGGINNNGEPLVTDSDTIELFAEDGATVIGLCTFIPFYGITIKNLTSVAMQCAYSPGSGVLPQRKISIDANATATIQYPGYAGCKFTFFLLHTASHNITDFDTDKLGAYAFRIPFNGTGVCQIN